MGSRGAFLDVNREDFVFNENGQNYYSIGSLSNDDNVKILLQSKGAVKAPEYSHTKSRVYAIVQNGMLKHISFYDESHRQVKAIDLLHTHGKEKLKPHIHYNLDHTDSGISINETDKKLIEQIKREYKLR
ncbi:MAG: hypothetical protein PUE08_01940 [Eubacteriales bacterium]|nr:hypothetical protein [Eubacteriales bacterium]